MKKEFFEFIFVCFLFSFIFVSKMIVPVKKKPIPVTNNDENAFSIRSFAKNPTSAPGIVAIIMYNHNLCVSFLNDKRA